MRRSCVRHSVIIMDGNKIHFRHILLFYFRRGKTAAEALRQIYDVYGEDAISRTSCKYWYRRFRSGDFSVDDAPRSGRPQITDDNQILKLVKNDPKLTSQEIGDRLNIHGTTVGRKLRKLGIVKKGELWVPLTD